mmetsp:Transcript_3875/g.6615  ORF Transcript_3875/g.6615 Transcript_3875/m.6615 type:complete len:237 (-) Transcript_3875:75-785(-)
MVSYHCLIKLPCSLNVVFEQAKRHLLLGVVRLVLCFPHATPGVECHPPVVGGVSDGGRYPALHRLDQLRQGQAIEKLHVLLVLGHVKVRLGRIAFDLQGRHVVGFGGMLLVLVSAEIHLLSRLLEPDVALPPAAPPVLGDPAVLGVLLDRRDVGENASRTHRLHEYVVWDVVVRVRIHLHLAARDALGNRRAVLGKPQCLRRRRRPGSHKVDVPQLNLGAALLLLSRLLCSSDAVH